MAQEFTTGIAPITSAGAAYSPQRPVTEDIGSEIKQVGKLVTQAGGDIYGATQAEEVAKIGSEINTKQQELHGLWASTPESQKLGQINEATKVGGDIAKLRAMAKAQMQSALSTYPQWATQIHNQFNKYIALGGTGEQEDEANQITAKEVGDMPLSAEEQRVKYLQQKATRDGSTVEEAYREQQWAHSEAMRRMAVDQYNQYADTVTAQYKQGVGNYIDTVRAGFPSAKLPPEATKQIHEFAEQQIAGQMDGIFTQCKNDGLSDADCQQIVERAGKDARDYTKTYIDRYDEVQSIKQDKENARLMARFDLEKYIPSVVRMKDLNLLDTENYNLFLQWMGGVNQSGMLLQQNVDANTYATLQDAKESALATMQQNGTTINDIIFKGDDSSLKVLNKDPSTTPVDRKLVAGRGATKQGAAFATVSGYSQPGLGSGLLTYGMTKNPIQTQELNKMVVRQDPRYFAVFNTPEMAKVLTNHPDWAPQFTELLNIQATEHIRPLLSKAGDPTVSIREIKGAQDYVPEKDQSVRTITDKEGKTHTVVITGDYDRTTSDGMQADDAIEAQLTFMYNNKNYGYKDPVVEAQAQINRQPVEDVEEEHKEDEIPVEPTKLSVQPSRLETMLGSTSEIDLLTTQRVKQFYTRNPAKRDEVGPALTRFVNSDVVPNLVNYRGNLEIQPAQRGQVRDTIGLVNEQGEVAPLEGRALSEVRKLLRVFRTQRWMLEEGQTPEEAAVDLINSQYEVPEDAVDFPEPTVPTGDTGIKPTFTGTGSGAQAAEAMGRAYMGRQPEVQPAPQEVAQPDGQRPLDESTPIDEINEKRAMEFIKKGKSLDEVVNTMSEYFGPEETWTPQTVKIIEDMRRVYARENANMEG